MRIAVDVSPLRTGNYLQHKVRGTGFYITNLLDALKKKFPEHEFVEFVRGDTLPKDIDVVHYPYFEPFFFTLPFRYTHKTVVTVHDLTPLRFPDLFPVGVKGTLKWQIQKQRLKRANAIVTDSNSSKVDIKEIVAIPEKKISVIYLAASPQFRRLQLSEKEIDTFRKKYHLPEKFVLYVGDVTPNKNLPVLIDAMKLINAPLVLVGKALKDKSYDPDHPWNKDLKKVNDEIHNNSQFHVLGFVPTEDLVMLYNIASVFVMPSFYEGFGLPLVEAMSCGAPVVMTNESSISEIGSGARVNYKDPHDFAQEIDQILKYDRFARQLSKESLERAKDFSWDKTAQKTMAVYERIMS